MSFVTWNALTLAARCSVACRLLPSSVSCFVCLTRKNQSFTRAKHLKAKASPPRSCREEHNDSSKLKFVPSEPTWDPDEFASEPVADIDLNTVNKLERLALVDFANQEGVDRLKSAIEFANQIQHCDIPADTEPMYTVLEDVNTYLREDVVTEPDNFKELMRVAPLHEEGFYVAPPGNIPLKERKKAYDDRSTTETLEDDRNHEKPKRRTVHKK